MGQVGSRGCGVTDALWEARAACRNKHVDPEWFFPEGRETYLMYQRAALHVCRSCPVLWECMRATLRWDEGVSMDDIFGIQGGMLQKQRRRIVRSKRRAAKRASMERVL